MFLFLTISDYLLQLTVLFILGKRCCWLFFVRIKTFANVRELSNLEKNTNTRYWYVGTAK